MTWTSMLFALVALVTVSSDLVYLRRSARRCTPSRLGAHACVPFDKVATKSVDSSSKVVNLRRTSFFFLFELSPGRRYRPSDRDAKVQGRDVSRKPNRHGSRLSRRVGGAILMSALVPCTCVEQLDNLYQSFSWSGRENARACARVLAESSSRHSAN